MGSKSRGGWMAPTGLMLSTQTKHPDETWDFLKFLFSPDQSLYFSGFGAPEKMQGVPVWASCYKDPRWVATEYGTTTYEQAMVSPVEMAFQNYGTWFWDYMNSGLTEMVLSKADPMTALNAIAEKTDNELLPEIQG
jgi:ABC-type glycerol-3-phosphate transport system substrate-binding protein